MVTVGKQSRRTETFGSIMLVSKCVKELGKLFRFFHALTLSPYEWNIEKRILQTTKSRCRLALWRFHVAFFVLNTVYTSAVFIVRILAQSFSSATELILHCIFMAADNSFVLMCFSCLLFASEMEELVNQVIKMDMMLSGEYSSIPGFGGLVLFQGSLSNGLVSMQSGTEAQQMVIERGIRLEA